MRELTTAFSVLHILFLCLSGAIQLLFVMSPLGDAVLVEGGSAYGSIWMEVMPNLLALLILLFALWYFARLVKGVAFSRSETELNTDDTKADEQEVQELRLRVTQLEDQLDTVQTMLLDRY